MEIEDSLRTFIQDELEYEGSETLTDKYPLLENEVIDSLSIFHIVNFLEDRYEISIEDEELVSENFRTIADIARLVRSKNLGETTD